NNRERELNELADAVAGAKLCDRVPAEHAPVGRRRQRREDHREDEDGQLPLHGSASTTRFTSRLNFFSASFATATISSWLTCCSASGRHMSVTIEKPSTFIFA